MIGEGDRAESEEKKTADHLSAKVSPSRDPSLIWRRRKDDNVTGLELLAQFGVDGGGRRSGFQLESLLPPNTMREGEKEIEMEARREAMTRRRCELSLLETILTL